MTATRTVDGVTVVHAERPGATTANLMFRVGQGDEDLPERGITHLLEHLALFPLGIRDHHSNGQTGVHITNFHATGTSTEVVSFLGAVCESLSAPPVSRLNSEKLVLRTEASQRAGWSFSDLVMWRHGARGDGRAAYPEWGRDHVTEAQLLAWRDRYFTAGNAVLLVVGPTVPEGLRLPLPDGPRRPATPLGSIAPSGRTYFSSGQGAVLFEAVVERSTDATLVAQMLNRLMYQGLRLDDAYSYTAGCGYEPRDADTAWIRGYADALDEQVDAVVGAMVDLLAQVRVGGFPDDLVTSTVALRLEGLDDEESAVGIASSVAYDLLLDADPLPAEDYRARLEAVTPETVRVAAARIMNDLILQVPVGRQADWGGFAELPQASEHRVQATAVHRSLDNDGALHLAPSGISRVSSGPPSTVLFASCAACLAWPDGKRLLIGDDGFLVTVEPTLYEDGAAAVSAIDQQVAPEVVIPQPERAAEDIPVPPPAPVATSGGWLKRRKKSG